VVFYVLRALGSLFVLFGRAPSPEAKEEGATRAAIFTILPVYALVALYAGWLIKGNLAPLPGVSQWRLGFVGPILLLIVFFIVVLVVGCVFFIRRQLDREHAERRMRERENAGESDEQLRRRRRSFVVLVTTLFWLVIFSGLFYVALSVITAPDLLLQQLRTAGVDYIIDAVIVFAAALIIMLLAPFGAIVLVYLWGDDSRDKSAKRLGYLRGSALLLGSTFLAAFMLTFVSPPPLPVANVGGSTSVQGHLLTHVDGYWYVFNRKGNLVATQDDKVTDVEICSTTIGNGASACTRGE
jgi:hypothetical protein